VNPGGTVRESDRLPAASGGLCLGRLRSAAPLSGYNRRAPPARRPSARLGRVSHARSGRGHSSTTAEAPRRCSGGITVLRRSSYDDRLGLAACRVPCRCRRTLRAGSRGRTRRMLVAAGMITTPDGPENSARGTAHRRPVLRTTTVARTRSPGRLFTLARGDDCLFCSALPVRRTDGRRACPIPGPATVYRLHPIQPTRPAARPVHHHPMWTPERDGGSRSAFVLRRLVLLICCCSSVATFWLAPQAFRQMPTTRPRYGY